MSAEEFILQSFPTLDKTDMWIPIVAIANGYAKSQTEPLQQQIQKLESESHKEELALAYLKQNMPELWTNVYRAGGFEKLQEKINNDLAKIWEEGFEAGKKHIVDLFNSK